MSDAEDQTLSLNAQLTLSEPSAHPPATNVHGIAYVDLEFIRDQRGIYNHRR
jgi:hypothetical protein